VSDGQVERHQHLGDLSGADAADVAEELTLATLDLDPADGEGTVRVWVEGSAPAWTRQTLPGFTLQLSTVDPDLPPLTGACERLQRPHPLDLAPPQWEEERQKVMRRRSLLRRGGGGAALWLLLLLGLMVRGFLEERKVQALERRVEERSGIVDEVGMLGAQVRSMSAFIDRSGSVLNVMYDFSRAVPGSGGQLAVTEFRYDKDRGVSFSGDLAGSETLFLDFIENLAASEIYRVEDYTLKEDRRGGRSFQVSTRWRWDVSTGDAP
jgi:hypothetical protein